MKLFKKAVIPAAGYGTRFLPISKVVPKELLSIGNKPAIHYVVEEAVRAGIEQVIFVCHPEKPPIVDYFRPDEALNAFLKSRGKKEELDELARLESLADFRVVFQEEPLGLGHAVWCARQEIGDDPFLVLLPDVLMADTGPGATAGLADACSQGKGWGLLLERLRPEEVSSYGIVRGEMTPKGDYRIAGAVEKPKPQEAPSNLGILGRYALPPDILLFLEDLKAGAMGEVQLTDAVDALARKRSGIGRIYEGDCFDIGVPQGLRAAQTHFERTGR